MAEPRAYAAIAAEYAADVVAGAIPACAWTRAACTRQQRDQRRAAAGDFPFAYDAERGARVCRFIELLPHIKGKWAGTPIRLEPWQVFILMTVFSWVGAEGTERTGLRRFRTVYIEVPRKNAKSTLTSGVGLYMLALDGEGGAECYSAATTKDQAKIVWQDAHSMARRSPGFRNRFGVEVGAHAIVVPGTDSKFIPLAAEDSSLDGLNGHFIAVDELHAHKTRGLYDVLETSTGARSQSLLWSITTAGTNQAGICFEIRTYATKVLDGSAEDETFFGVIWTLDQEDIEAERWFEPAMWQKANPNYGVSVMPDDIARLATKAAELPSALNNYLTKRLNVWVNADSAWLPPGVYQACADPTLSMEDFTGARCFVAIDLTSKTDIAAMMYLFPEVRADERLHVTAFGRFYLPEATIQGNANSQYEGWEESGFLTATPGNIVDMNRIQEDLREDRLRFEIQEVAYDGFQATKFATELAAEGFPMTEVGATVKNFSEPMKELAALIIDGRFHHDGNPALAWMFSNVVCHVDAKDNIYPRKQLPQNKIDGPVATIMGLNRILAELGPSTYEAEDLLVL